MFTSRVHVSPVYNQHFDNCDCVVCLVWPDSEHARPAQMHKRQDRPRGSDSAGRIITQHRPNRLRIIKRAQQAKMTSRQIRGIFDQTLHNARLAMVQRDF
jgi:hypothetical protein